jgi:hypothetical protein
VSALACVCGPFADSSVTHHGGHVVVLPSDIVNSVMSAPRPVVSRTAPSCSTYV